MAKAQRKKGSVKKASSQALASNRAAALFARHPHLFPLLILSLLLLVFFHEVVFGGKTLLPPDRINALSGVHFVKDALAQGIYPLWNPYIFSGMPSFASLQSAPFVDLLGDVVRLVAVPFEWVLSNSDFIKPLLNYFVFGLFAYLLLIKLSGHRIVALFFCIAWVFQPQVIAFVAFGHGTKLTTSAMIPIIFLLLDQFLEKRQIHYFALLALAVGLQLLRAHTQMAYYTFMMIGLYIIFWAAYSKTQKMPGQQIFKSVSFSIVALLIGVALSSWLYLSVLEYSHYSIRGGGAGLDYGYATGWSFSPKEIVTFFVPSFVGFGGQTYWGDMPFTDFPLYMGIVVLFFAGLAPVVRRDKYVFFFSLMGFLSLLVSFGKHVPFFYDALFNFLPFFNKFRVPSMILILLQFSVAVLAGLGLNALLQAKDTAMQAKVKKYVYIFLGVCGLIMLIVLLGKSSYLGWASKRLAPAGQQSAYQAAAGDAVKMFFIVLAAGAAVLLYLKKTFNATTLLVASIGLLVIDLWLVDFKIIHPRPKTDQSAYFAETPAVNFLKKQQDPFRIFQAADDKPPNWYQYHEIQNIQGYHAAKIKDYQKFLERSGLETRNRVGLPAFLGKYFDVVMNDGRPTLQQIPENRIAAEKVRADNAIMDMLNVRYLLSFYPIPDAKYRLVQQGRPSVYENTTVLPRAYFVDEVQVLKDNDAFFDYLVSGDFDPHKQAVLTEEPEVQIVPSPNNKVKVTSFGIHEIELEAEVDQPALLVVSEVYYPAGWRAFVDGEETKIHRVDGILRGIFLQPGPHDIRFVFSPASFKIGLAITASILLLLLALLSYGWKKSKQQSATS